MVVPSDPQREQVLRLIDEKDRIEKKIAELGLTLQKNKVGFDEPLVDAEGFPRNDIDVRSVRIARTQIICLQNDLKELTKSIEDGLEKFFIENKDKIQNTLQPGSSSSTTERPTTNDQNDNLQPFVIVNLVSPQSPAEEAGIEVRDLILSFGSIQKTNFKDLAQVGELVKNSIDQEIHVKVRRNGKVEELILIPKAWSGRGFLGCNIVPMPTI